MAEVQAEQSFSTSLFSSLGRGRQGYAVVHLPHGIAILARVEWYVGRINWLGIPLTNA
jgi:hypothetical protein